MMAMALSVALLAFGCGDDAPPTPPDGGAATEVTRLEVVENPVNPLSFFVSWETSYSIPTELLVDCGDDYRQTFSDGVARGSHEVFVMGLFEGLDCDFTVHPGADVTGETTARIEDVGPVPALLPELDVRIVDEARMQPGWTMFSLASSQEEVELIVVAMDPQGRYRWTFSPGMGVVGAGAEITVHPEGIMIGAGIPHLLMTTWEGEILWRVDVFGHHDIRRSPWDPDNILMLSQNHESGGCGEHSAIEYDLSAEEIIWEWAICDYWTPRLDYNNWSHLNTIEPFPGERAVLISSRDQDTLHKVDRDTGELVWTLGRRGDFAMNEEDYFARQHAPEIEPDGTILLFDNGLGIAEVERFGDTEALREYTRVMQYELFFDAEGNPDRAEVVWEYSTPEIFAENRSEADRLENGNTLIHYVWVHPEEELILREVTMDKEIVWDVHSPPRTSSYRSERIEPYYGHVITE
jgi:hypothetical protein